MCGVVVRRMVRGYLERISGEETWKENTWG